MSTFVCHCLRSLGSASALDRHRRRVHGEAVTVLRSPHFVVTVEQLPGAVIDGPRDTIEALVHVRELLQRDAISFPVRD